MDTYKDSDMSIGAHLNIYGRKVVLCDCDDFTKEYYVTKYGVGESDNGCTVGNCIEINTNRVLSGCRQFPCHTIPEAAGASNAS